MITSAPRQRGSNPGDWRRTLAGIACLLPLCANAAHPEFDGVFDPKALQDTKAVAKPPGPRDYVLFESGPVRPLARSADGTRLYAANIPDGRMEILAITDAGLEHRASVPVGLEPVAIAEAPGGKVWVVNHLSDSVSIVNVDAAVPHVERTLWVGDEPRDIVFAGPQRQRAFITTAHRGQNSPVDAESTRPGIGRADVWVFDSTKPGAGPLTILTLFGDTPRALAATPDGATVYAAVFHSGNRTTTLPPNNFPKPPPLQSADGVPQPDTGLIVQFNGANWVDETGRAWDNRVGFSLPDDDVFEIDAAADPPVERRSFSGVGTTLFNMAVNPVNGDVYVSNTEARNRVRFSGDARRADTTVRGRVTDNRITVIADGDVKPRHLNKHLDFERRFGTAAERAASLSTPLDMVVSGDGERLYIAAFGSRKIAGFDTAELSDDSFTPDAGTHVELSGGGPAGLVLDEDRGRLYVLTRFDNAVKIVDLDRRREIQSLALFNPEPRRIVDGRPFLYDARQTSSRGNDSCASCHVFGNVDALAWDLGDPDARVKSVPNAYHPITANHPGLGFTFHPMKGPMMTQSMRGLRRHGPMHWRGDRTGADRDEDETLEAAAFKEFNDAFQAFGARREQLTEADMQKFTDFALELTYPPNPHRGLDDSLNASQSLGREMFNDGFARPGQPVEFCSHCHTLRPDLGLFGTAGLMAFNNQPGEKDFKIPHFRDQYQKVGMFGPSLSNPFLSGPQIRGFGYNHNGATSSSAILSEFDLPPDRLRAIREYLIAFPTESAPVLGQQVSVSAGNHESAMPRVELLMARAAVTEPVPECDLVVAAPGGDRMLGWLYDPVDGAFLSDEGTDADVTREEMLATVAASEMPYTFTCTPWGSGKRIALDRDGDGALNGIERDRGSLPDNPGDSGIWYDPAQDGHGLFFEFIQSNGKPALLASWYVYLDGQQVWLTGVGAIEADTATVPLTITSGGDFPPAFDPADVSSELWGELTVAFDSKDSARVTWTTDYAGFGNGELDVQPLASPLGNDDNPDGAGIRACHSGSWYDPAQDGHGFQLQVVDVGGEHHLVAAWYVYNDGEQIYLVGSGPIVEGEAEVELFITDGGQFPPAFDPDLVSQTSWGTATFTFERPDNGRVSWSTGTEGFSNGSLDIIRLTTQLGRRCD